MFSFVIELFLSISFDPGLPSQTKKNNSSAIPYLSTKLVFVKHINLTFCPWCESVPWEDYVHGTFLAFKTPGSSKCGKYQFKEFTLINMIEKIQDWLSRTREVNYIRNLETIP